MAGTAIVKVFGRVVAMTGLSSKAASAAGIEADHVLIYFEAEETLLLFVLQGGAVETRVLSPSPDSTWACIGPPMCWVDICWLGVG